MTHVHLATALVRRGAAVLLVASRYTNHERPLWNLPGGRQVQGELLAQTALRELREETGLEGTLVELCYVSESYDGDTHFLNATFSVHAEGQPRREFGPGDHVVDVDWVDAEMLAERLSVAVVREPLLAYLEGTLPGYAGFEDAGITIVFPD